MNAAAPPTAARIPPCWPCTMAAAAVELDADAPEAVGVPELAGVVDEPSDEVAPVEELGDAVEATVTLLEAAELEAAELVELDEEWVVAPVAVLVPVPVAVPVEELVAEEQPADVGKSVTPTVAQSSWAYLMVASISVGSQDFATQQEILLRNDLDVQMHLTSVPQLFGIPAVAHD
jgi:hypothetical protein